MTPRPTPAAGKYRTIAADPPWAYARFPSDPTSGRGLPIERREKVRIDPLPYTAMTVSAIASLPIRALADSRGCRLFLWTTNRYLPQAFEIMGGWGFEYRQTLIWHKTGNPSPFSASLAPNHAEFLLVGTCGSVPVLSKIKSNVIAAPAQRSHSRKPETFTDLIEQVSPGPYVELFARRQRLQWDSWGLECHNTANFEVPA